LVTAFRFMGVNIREHHYSTQDDVAKAALTIFGKGNIRYLQLPFAGQIYQVGHFRRT